jgi:hypothetical protein
MYIISEKRRNPGHGPIPSEDPEWRVDPSNHHRWRRQQGRRRAHHRRRRHRSRRRAHHRPRRGHRFMLHTCTCITLYNRYSFRVRSPVSPTAFCQLGLAHKPIAHPAILAPPVAWWHCLEPSEWTIPEEPVLPPCSIPTPIPVFTPRRLWASWGCRWRSTPPRRLWASWGCRWRSTGFLCLLCRA